MCCWSSRRCSSTRSRRRATTVVTGTRCTLGLIMIWYIYIYALCGCFAQSQCRPHFHCAWLSLLLILATVSHHNRRVQRVCVLVLVCMLTLLQLCPTAWRVTSIWTLIRWYIGVFVCIRMRLRACRYHMHDVDAPAHTKSTNRYTSPAGYRSTWRICGLTNYCREITGMRDKYLVCTHRDNFGRSKAKTIVIVKRNIVIDISQIRFDILIKSFLISFVTSKS